MALAAGTDVLDGTIARRRGASTAGMGSWLDPICDKLFVGAVLAALHFERGVPLSLLALIVARELMQLPMVVVYRAVPDAAALAALRLPRQPPRQGRDDHAVPRDRRAGDGLAGGRSAAPGARSRSASSRSPTTCAARSRSASNGSADTPKR